MKKFLHLCLGAFIALFITANAFAQSFEGTLTMEVSSQSFGDKAIPMSISTKGDKSVIHIDAPQGSMTMIMDRSTNKMTMVMAAQKMGMEMDMKKMEEMAGKAEDKTSVKATGESKVINGYKCELYTVSSEKGGLSNLWMTKDLPKSMTTALMNAFKHGSMGFSRGRKSGSSAVIEELFEKGLLPIRMESTSKEGKIESSVTFLKYEQKSLDDSIFAIPTDIKIMQMPAGMGGQ